jgi:hypothetical protein
MTDTDDKKTEAINALLDAITRNAKEGSPSAVRDLAEAYGWVIAPSRAAR